MLQQALLIKQINDVKEYAKDSEITIYIDDTAGISIMEIRAKCRKLKIEKDIIYLCTCKLGILYAANDG